MTNPSPGCSPCSRRCRMSSARSCRAQLSPQPAQKVPAWFWVGPLKSHWNHSPKDLAMSGVWIRMGRAGSALWWPVEQCGDGGSGSSGSWNDPSLAQLQPWHPPGCCPWALPAAWEHCREQFAHMDSSGQRNLGKIAVFLSMDLNLDLISILASSGTTVPRRESFRLVSCVQQLRVLSQPLWKWQNMGEKWVRWDQNSKGEQGYPKLPLSPLGVF